MIDFNCPNCGKRVLGILPTDEPDTVLTALHHCGKCGRDTYLILATDGHLTLLTPKQFNAHFMLHPETGHYTTRTEIEA